MYLKKEKYVSNFLFFLYDTHKNFSLLFFHCPNLLFRHSKKEATWNYFLVPLMNTRVQGTCMHIYEGRHNVY